MRQPGVRGGAAGGRTLIDLGSGAGIDCFIAARRVGSEGRVFGIDMTDQMLAVARESQPKVAAALGYDNVEFRKGILEQVPVDAASADIVTSNCVINLSPDKSAVFRENLAGPEGRRPCRDRGHRRRRRSAAADARGRSAVGRVHQRSAVRRRVSRGARALGFYGVSILKKAFWREVEGTRFYSVTVRGFKFEKKAGCRYIGQFAVYLGPMKSVVDEEGHLFPRGVPIEVCTDTATKLSAAPYAGKLCGCGRARVDGWLQRRRRHLWTGW